MFIIGNFSFILPSQQAQMFNTIFVRIPSNRNPPEQNPNYSNPKSKQKIIKQIEYSPNQGHYWNSLGKQAFKNKEYDKALEHYNKAIEIYNTESQFFCNRARLYKIIKDFQKGINDAQIAMQLDDKFYKAYLIHGQILAQASKNNNDLNKIDLAIKRITKALSLIDHKKMSSKRNKVSKYLYRAKKLRYYYQKELLSVQINKLKQSYKQYCQKNNISQQEYKKVIYFLQFIQMTCLSNTVRQIPEYLICPITYQLMEDPVVVETGHTYQRDVLISNIEMNGKIDPLTRQPISGRLYPNIGLKKATQQFLYINPWAYQFNNEQNYKTIEF